MDKQVLTVEEAGQLLRIGRSAAYEAVRRGQIPSLRIGRSVRVPRHALEEMLTCKNDGAPAKSAAVQESVRPDRHGQD